MLTVHHKLYDLQFENNKSWSLVDAVSYYVVYCFIYISYRLQKIYFCSFLCMYRTFYNVLYKTTLAYVGCGHYVDCIARKY